MRTPRHRPSRPLTIVLAAVVALGLAGSSAAAPGAPESAAAPAQSAAGLDGSAPADGDLEAAQVPGLSVTLGAGAVIKPANLPVQYGCRTELVVPDLLTSGIRCGVGVNLTPPAQTTIGVEATAGRTGGLLELACGADVTFQPIGLQPTGCGIRPAPITFQEPSAAPAEPAGAQAESDRRPLLQLASHVAAARGEQPAAVAEPSDEQPRVAEPAAEAPTRIGSGAVVEQLRDASAAIEQARADAAAAPRFVDFLRGAAQEQPAE